MRCRVGEDAVFLGFLILIFFSNLCKWKGFLTHMERESFKLGIKYNSGVGYKAKHIYPIYVQPLKTEQYSTKARIQKRVQAAYLYHATRASLGVKRLTRNWKEAC